MANLHELHKDEGKEIKTILYAKDFSEIIIVFTDKSITTIKAIEGQWANHELTVRRQETSLSETTC